MGAWGEAAWDNDGAADWYGDLFDATGLAKHVEAALNLDPEDSAEEIRAAAYLLVTLGRVYIWPVGDLDRHLGLAIEKLESIKALGEYQEVPEFVAAIDEELAVLRSRIKPPAREA